MKTVAPFAEVIMWPKMYEYWQNTLTCNTIDGIQVDVTVAFQYLPESDQIYDLTKLYRDVDAYDKVLQWRARSAIRHACAEFDTIQFQTERDAIGLAMEARLYAELTPAVKEGGHGTKLFEVSKRCLSRQKKTYKFENGFPPKHRCSCRTPSGPRRTRLRCSPRRTRARTSTSRRRSAARR